MPDNNLHPQIFRDFGYQCLSSLVLILHLLYVGFFLRNLSVDEAGLASVLGRAFLVLFSLVISEYRVYQKHVGDYQKKMIADDLEQELTPVLGKTFSGSDVLRWTPNLHYRSVPGVYPKSPKSPDFVLGPVSCLQDFVKNFSGKNILRSRLPDYDVWRSTYLPFLKINSNRVLQYRLFLQEFQKFINFIYYPYADKHSLRDVYGKAHPLLPFIDMLFRDAHLTRAAKDAKISVLRKHMASDHWSDYLVSGIFSVPMSESLPLRCFPVAQFNNTQTLVKELQLLPKYGQMRSLSRFLDTLEFCAMVRGLHCGSCRYAGDNLSFEASLLSHPLLRDRALFSLNSSEQEQPSIANHVLKQLYDLSLFSSTSPFILMQRFILYLEDQLKQYAGSSATVLGSFKPVTKFSEFPVPIFKRDDGELLAFLWHGTKFCNADSIATMGFLQQKSARQLYGPGTYFAIQACKSLQYTENGRACLFLCAVFLGKDPFFFDHGGLRDRPHKEKVIIAHPGNARYGRQSHWEIISRAENNVVPLIKLTVFNPKNRPRVPWFYGGSYESLDSCPVM